MSVICNKVSDCCINHKSEVLVLASISFAKSFSRVFGKVSIWGLVILFSVLSAQAQNYPQQNNLMQMPNPSNYPGGSNIFKQEIARLEINVVRQGKTPLPITQVPRLAKDDVLKVRLLDEQVNGLKLDQSNFDWTFLVAFVNPGRKNDSEETISEEINFKKHGWYKEYSFVVPYDSQAIFFIYTKSQYRNKILSLISKNSDDIRKLGEKTIEISDAYAKIGSFLNELQSMLFRTPYGTYGGYGYGSYGNYGMYNGYNNYNYYGNRQNADKSFNTALFMHQSVEQMAKSFNIQLPACWGNNSNQGMYNGGMYGGGYGNYGYYGNNGTSSWLVNDLITRIQCVARSVRVEDLDLSIGRMLQQGGVLIASQLAQKYPQIAFWINIAATAIDAIIQFTKKTPLKIVPTIISAQEASMPMASNSAMPTAAANLNPVKISLFAESQPGNNGFVTAYPLVVNKWQANTDPEIISLPIPYLADSCLHAGQNVLRSTDLINDWMSDTFTKNFTLVVSSQNGFKKEFPLRKNIGLNGWELNLTKEDAENFPRISMNIEAEIVGKRGFNEIRSPKFQLAVPASSAWEITGDSQKAFAAGGKRTIKLRNRLGSCKCLQAVIYKPSFGGEFVFEANAKSNPLVFSEDEKEVSLEIDTTMFTANTGQLELRTYGGETNSLNINLHPTPPNISSVLLARGERKPVVVGQRLEQIKAININGKRALPETGSMASPMVSKNSMPGIGVSANQITERTFIFEDENARQETNSFSVVLELENIGTYNYPKIFNVSPARPTLVSKQFREIEAVATLSRPVSSQFDLESLPVFPIYSSKISLIVQNALTDYDFKIENIEIESNIENSQITSMDLPPPLFEVLDWKNMRIDFQLDERLQMLLGGRRLQFRIKDKLRGYSDWYTIGKTFARIPENIAVKCGIKGGGNCQITGKGIEYIGQVSVDGGKTWLPSETSLKSGSNGEKYILTPLYSTKNLLQIKLRDYPMTQGLPVRNYVLTSK